jgi:hypothetical protein
MVQAWIQGQGAVALSALTSLAFRFCSSFCPTFLAGSSDFTSGPAGLRLYRFTPKTASLRFPAAGGCLLSPYS